MKLPWSCHILLHADRKRDGHMSQLWGKHKATEHKCHTALFQSAKKIIKTGKWSRPTRNVKWLHISAL